MSAEQIAERLKSKSLGLPNMGQSDLSGYLWDPELQARLKDRGLGKLRIPKVSGEKVFYLQGISLKMGEEMKGDALAFYDQGRPSKMLLLGSGPIGVEFVFDFEYSLQKDYRHPLSDEPLSVTRTIIKGWHSTPNGKRTDKLGISVNAGFFGSIPEGQNTREYTSLSNSEYQVRPGGLVGKSTTEYIETVRVITLAERKSVLYRTSFEADQRGLLLRADESNIGPEALQLFPRELGIPDTIVF